jgi:hypothetical protein
MENFIPGHRQLTEEDFRQMWRECTFAFDASMLLNIYRYPSNTLDIFFTILERLKDRIWIPYQVAVEYHKNREVVIAYQLNMYDSVVELFNKSYGSIKNELDKFKRHSSIKPEQLLELFQSGIQQVKESLKHDKENHPNLAASDPLREKLIELFSGKVGSPFDNNRLSEIYLEAEQRFKIKQPPGFEDAKNKPIPERYGDVVVWFQLIEYAKATQKPLIFVTDERKEDWWLRQNNKTVSPRPELTYEIQTQAGIKFYMYHSEQFIKYLEAQQAAIEEVVIIGKQDEEYQSAIDYSASHSWINLRAFENARLFDNSLIQRAIEQARAFDNALVRQAVEAARKFDDYAIQRAIEQARRFDNYFVRKAMEQARGFENANLRQAIEQATSFDSHLIREAVEKTKSFDSPAIRQAVEAVKTFDNSAMRHAAETIRLWQSNQSYRQPMPRHINVEISPKRSSDLQDNESKDVKVEVLRNTDIYGSSEDEAVEDKNDPDKRAKTPPYEFNEFPLTVTLIRFPNSEHPHRTLHRLRKPTFDEWEEWGLNIESSRRLLSPAELEEYYGSKSKDEEKNNEVWRLFYAEWEASKRLYDRIILEIAGLKLDKNDDFPIDQFRKLPPDIIDKLWFESKETVITRLYECYCGLEKPVSLNTEVQRVIQRLSHKSSSFDVTHVLRKPTEDESYEFRTNIVKGYFSADKDNQEIIQLKLNLPVAVEFYNRLIINIENATTSGQPFSDEMKDAFLEAINPVYKLRVLGPIFDVNAWYFKIDEMKFL